MVKCQMVELKENDRNGTENDASRDARAVNVRRVRLMYMRMGKEM
jgi:hypothetical protein